MLHDQPGGFRPIRSHLRLTRPAPVSEDGRQPVGVGPVHGAHPRLVPVEQRAVRGELGPDAIVFIGHRQELAPDVAPPGLRHSSRFSNQWCAYGSVLNADTSAYPALRYSAIAS